MKRFTDFTKAKQEKLNWLYDQDEMSQSEFEKLYYCVDDNGNYDSELHNQMLYDGAY